MTDIKAARTKYDMREEARKKCLNCGEEKPVSQFGRRKRQKGGLYYYCKECVHKYNTSEKSRERNKRYKKTHPLTDEQRAKQNEYLKKYYLEHKDRHNELHKKWLSDPDNQKLNTKLKLKYKKTDKGRAAEYRYRHSPVGRSTALKNSALRRAGGNITSKDWRWLSKINGGVCPLCSGSGKVHIDHWIPVMLGGKTVFGNLVPICKSCNHRKGKREPVKFVVENFGCEALERVLILLSARPE